MAFLPKNVEETKGKKELFYGFYINEEETLNDKVSIIFLGNLESKRLLNLQLSARVLKINRVKTK